MTATNLPLPINSAPAPSASAPSLPLRAQQLIAQLQLQPHPEGGWYREVFRSAQTVVAQGSRHTRSALTSIYFLLATGQHSRWHCVLSDEVWIHLEGLTLDLWSWDALTSKAVCTCLGPVSTSTESAPGISQIQAQHIIEAGLWQAAQAHSPGADAASGFTLVACVVAPGFDFSDFSMMQAGDANAARLSLDHPHLARFI
jgi:predicted cupin superfamily sugar epimerase